MRYLAIQVASLTCTCMLTNASVAQQEGWHYSHLPGEGDRASMGCASGSEKSAFTCLAVRCEDDFTTGIYVHTSKSGGDLGNWDVTIDKETEAFLAEAANSPYGARLRGDTSWLLDGLKYGGVAYLDFATGEPLPKNSIPLSGSLLAINEALAFCAPRTLKAAPGQSKD